MKSSSVVVLAAAILAGCHQDVPPSIAGNDSEPSISDVTLRSHLAGTDAADPQIQTGQVIRVVPDPSEPTQKHESVVVQLPAQTPYGGDDEQYFLRGYAIGQLSLNNFQFL